MGFSHLEIRWFLSPFPQPARQKMEHSSAVAGSLLSDTDPDRHSLASLRMWFIHLLHKEAPGDIWAVAAASWLSACIRHNIVHQEHWAQIIHRSDSGSPRQDPGKILENTVLTWKLQFLVFHGRWVLTEALIMVPGTCILGSPCHWILGYQTVLESRLTFSLY